MQTIIAILAVALIDTASYLTTHGNMATHQPQKHLETLVTALVEFHKVQCYFAGAIQIAAAVFAVEVIRVTQDYASAEMLFILATNSSVPIIFTLIAIQRYGQQSWYLIFLSLSCFLLSTMTLILSYVVFWRFNNRLGYLRSNQVEDCGGHDYASLFASWCGSNVPFPTKIDYSTIKSGWNWALWTNCAAWLLYCILERSLGQNSVSNARAARLLQKTVRWVSVWMRPLFETIWLTRLQYLLFAASWSTALGYQIFLYSIPFTHAQVATMWTFGQVVAITVWTPCIAEYLYLERGNRNLLLTTKLGAELSTVGMFEGSRYRLPKGFIVARDHHALPTEDLVSRGGRSVPHDAVPPRTMQHDIQMLPQDRFPKGRGMYTEPSPFINGRRRFSTA